MKELIAEVVINNYIREVVVSSYTRAVYFKQKVKTPLPLRFCDSAYYKQTKIRVLSDKFEWAKKKKDRLFYLYDKSTGERVIKNEKTVGFAKSIVINGQDLHSLTLPDYFASKIKKALKEQFSKETEKLEPIIKVPIIVELELRDTYQDLLNQSNPNWDVDNRVLFYNKVFVDVLAGTPLIEGKKIVKTTKEIIPNDHRGYVTGGGHLFTPISVNETRQMIFRIYHDLRESVKDFKNFHNGDNKLESVTINLSQLLLNNTHIARGLFIL
jgi:hypothetical protein